MSRAPYQSPPFILAEVHGERPRFEDMHIRKDTGTYYYPGGRDNLALCGLTAKLHDHPTPPIEAVDLSKVCPSCKRAFETLTTTQPAT